MKKILMCLLVTQNLYCSWNTSPYTPYSLKNFTSAKVTHSSGTLSHITNVPLEIYIYKVKDRPYDRDINSLFNWSYRRGSSKAYLSVPRAIQDGTDGIKFQVFGDKLKYDSAYTSHYYYIGTDLVQGNINSLVANARVTIDADKNMNSILNYEVGVRIQSTSTWRRITAKIYVQMALQLKAFSLDFGSYMIGSGKEIKTSTKIYVEGNINSAVRIEVESRDIEIENSNGDRLTVRLSLDGMDSKDINLGYDGEEKINLEAEVVDTPADVGDYYGVVKVYATYI